MLENKPYLYIPIKENHEKMVKLSNKNFAFVFATNYTAREKLALMLLKASKNLPSGFKFKILDSWRSIESQLKMVGQFEQNLKNRYPDWDKEQIEKEIFKFAAPVTNDPKKPPPHNTGGSIDLAIVDSMGNDPEMDQKSNKLSEKSLFNYYANKNSKLEKGIHKNRFLLRTLLTEVGFAPNDNEWWHFDYGNQRWAYYYKKPYAIYGPIHNSS